MTATELRSALDSPNVLAFLALIRAGEGTPDPDGYRRLFGGELFDGYADHPRRVVTKSGYTSTAAGAYQILARTWDGLVKQYGFSDFSPANQDLAAVALIVGRGALPDVLAGRIEQAIAKCAREWASLPGSPYGQPTRTLEQALATYTAAGGALGEPSTSRSPTIMAPFIPLAIEAISAVVPSLIKVFGSGPIAERNAQAAQIVVDAAKAATGAANEQQLIETIKSDPAAVRQVQQAVEGVWFQLTEAGGGGVDGARKFAASGIDALHSPAFILSCVLLVFPLLLSVDVFFFHPENYQSELRTQIVTGLLMVISMVGAFWLGSSFGSARKNELFDGKA